MLQEEELAKWKKAYAALAGDSDPAAMHDRQGAQPPREPQFLRPARGGEGPVIRVCSGDAPSGGGSKPGAPQPSFVVQEPDSPGAGKHRQGSQAPSKVRPTLVLHLT